MESSAIEINEEEMSKRRECLEIVDNFFMSNKRICFSL